MEFTILYNFMAYFVVEFNFTQSTNNKMLFISQEFSANTPLTARRLLLVARIGKEIVHSISSSIIRAKLFIYKELYSL